MNRPEPIELENNLGPDAVTGEINRVPWMAYDVDEMDLYIAEKDAEIAELKADNERLKYEKRKMYTKMQHDTIVDALCREHRQQLRSTRRALWLARANSARNSYLKWNLFANFESEEKLFTIDEYDETPGATDGRVLQTYTGWVKIWKNVERKCRAKAEEYK